MKPYSEKSKCGACGCDSVGTRFRDGKMARRCGRCGYEWPESPLYEAKGQDGLLVSLDGIIIGKIVLDNINIEALA